MWIETASRYEYQRALGLILLETKFSPSVGQVAAPFLDGRKRTGRAVNEMRSNHAMQELLLRYDVDEGQSYTLEPTLLSLLNSGIRVIDGAYLFVQLEGSVKAPRSQFEDLTGYECAVNHFHLEAILSPPNNKNPEALLRNGVTFMQRLSSQLETNFPREPFRIIFSYSDTPLVTCVVRFHKIRENEEWIIVDDLEGYKSEALMVLDVPGAP